MSVPKHIKEHTQLGLTSIAQEWSGIQPDIGREFVPPILGEVGATNETTLTNGLLLVPMQKPVDAGNLISIAVVTDNNVGTAANRVRLALWDGNGNLLDDKEEAIPTLGTNGRKEVSYAFTPVSIPTKDFWIGFSFFDSTVRTAYLALNIKAGKPFGFPGYKGALADPTVGTTAAVMYAIANANPDVAVPDPLVAGNMVTTAPYDLCPVVGAQFENA